MEVDASDGRISLPEGIREEYGDRFHLVERDGRLVLLPIADDPLAALRDEFADVEKSARELRDDTREVVSLDQREPTTDRFDRSR